MGNTISRYKADISNVEKSIRAEIRDTEKAHSQEIREKERKIREVQRQIDEKHKGQTSDLSTAEDTVALIKNEKQSCLDNIDRIKNIDMTNVQNFLNNYTIDFRTTKEVVVGIPIFIFYFVDPNTSRTTERAPILPILVDKGKPVRTKAKDNFRKIIRDLLNKDNSMINLADSGAESGNLMDMKNLDTRLEDAINDLRVKKILGKKEAATAKDIIVNLVW